MVGACLRILKSNSCAEVALASAELSSTEAAWLASDPPNDAEREILSRAISLPFEDDMGNRLVAFLRESRRLTVIFTSFSSTARLIESDLQQSFGPTAVATHLLGADPAEVEDSLDRFRDPDDSCWI